MDIICLSHLRWNFVYQRPQHILSRLANQFRVFFVEEPIFDTDTAFLDNTISREGVWILVPHLAAEMDDAARSKTIHQLLQRFFNYFEICSIRIFPDQVKGPFILVSPCPGQSFCNERNIIWLFIC